MQTETHEAHEFPTNEAEFWAYVQQRVDFHAYRLSQKWYIRRHGFEKEDISQMMMIHLIKHSFTERFRRGPGWKTYIWKASEFAAGKIRSYFMNRLRREQISTVQGDAENDGQTITATISDSDRMRHRRISDDDPIESLEKREIIELSLNGSTDRQKIIFNCFMTGQSPEELAVEVGVSRPTIDNEFLAIGVRMKHYFSQADAGRKLPMRIDPQAIAAATNRHHAPVYMADIQPEPIEDMRFAVVPKAKKNWLTPTRLVATQGSLS